MTPPRLAALDQYRGLTVLAMFAVNFLGHFAVVPEVLKHRHTFCSLADVVMPQFLLAVGVGMRLSYLRRREHGGWSKAVGGLARRNLGLILLGVILYHLTGKYHHWNQLVAQSPGEFLLATIKRHPFETLTHIGVTSLWVLPVIGAAGWVRLLFASASGCLHVWASFAGYYEWNLTDPVGIDGGPLGFLTWTIPLIAGTLVADWLVSPVPNPATEGVGEKLIGAAGVLMAAGYVLSCLNRWSRPNIWGMTGDWWRDQLADPPFVPLSEPWQLNYWTMSQRAGSVTYLLFATGFALGLFAAVRAARVRWGYLDLLGRHALAGYIIHDMVAGAVKPFAPADAPAWYVAAAFGVYLGLTSLVLRHLDRAKLVLRL